jgi:hypothetical protein
MVAISLSDTNILRTIMGNINVTGLFYSTGSNSEINKFGTITVNSGGSRFVVISNNLS